MKQKQNIVLLPKKNEYILKAYTHRTTIKYRCVNSFLETQCLSKYVNKSYFDGLCKIGCPNYGNKWSCPPYSPDYHCFVKNYRYIDVIMLSAKMEAFSYIRQDYLKIKAANSVLKSRIDKALRLCLDHDEFYISTGSCRLCKPCKKKVNEKCAHPTKRSYSFEALGINVSALTKDLFDTELLWYKKHELPEYTCVVGGLLTNRKEVGDKIITQLIYLK